MTPESTLNEVAIPEAWDAKLILEFLGNPAFDEFNTWIDAELETLENRWQYASSPNAWTGGGRGRSQRSA